MPPPGLITLWSQVAEAGTFSLSQVARPKGTTGQGGCAAETCESRPRNWPCRPGAGGWRGERGALPWSLDQRHRQPSAWQVWGRGAGRRHPPEPPPHPPPSITDGLQEVTAWFSCLPGELPLRPTASPPRPGAPFPGHREPRYPKLHLPARKVLGNTEPPPPPTPAAPEPARGLGSRSSSLRPLSLARSLTWTKRRVHRTPYLSLGGFYPGPLQQ